MIDIVLLRKKISFRANHRGIKEMDLILGSYVDAKINSLNLDQLKQLSFIMSFDDRDLYSWFLGDKIIPDKIRVPIFDDILRFHKIELGY